VISRARISKRSVPERRRAGQDFLVHLTPEVER
jgi:hypothetical protein